MSCISFAEQQVLKNVVVNKLNINLFCIFQLRVFVFHFCISAYPLYYHATSI